MVWFLPNDSQGYLGIQDNQTKGRHLETRSGKNKMELLKQCTQACDGKPDCTHFVWCNRDTNECDWFTGGYGCSLQDFTQSHVGGGGRDEKQFGNTRSRHNIATFFKPGGKLVAPENARFIKLENIANWSGSKIREFTASSAKPCVEECYKAGRCNKALYRSGDKRCFLYASSKNDGNNRVSLGETTYLLRSRARCEDYSQQECRDVCGLSSPSSCETLYSNYCSQGSRVWTDPLCRQDAAKFPREANKVRMEYCKQGDNFKKPECMEFCNGWSGKPKDEGANNPSSTSIKEECNTLYKEKCSDPKHSQDAVCSCFRDFDTFENAHLFKHHTPRNPVCYFKECNQYGYKTLPITQAGCPTSICVANQNLNIENAKDVLVDNIKLSLSCSGNTSMNLTSSPVPAPSSSISETVSDSQDVLVVLALGFAVLVLLSLGLMLL
jgi:hypothetical protein